MLLAMSLVSWNAALAHQGDRLQSALEVVSGKAGRAREQGLLELAAAVKAQPELAVRSEVQLAVAKLLTDENRRIGVAAFEGDAEANVEFYEEELVPLAFQLLRVATPDAMPALVASLLDGHFNTGSTFSRHLASVGEGAVVALLSASTSPDIYTRSKAYDIMGLTLANNGAGAVRQSLTAQSAKAMRTALLRGLLDADTVCRRDAVRALVAARHRAALPSLRKLAATDPDYGQSGLPANSVRGLAARAIIDLERR